MYLISKTYSIPEMKIAEMVKDNPVILLVLENFGVNDFDKDDTIMELCGKMNISVNLFTLICNLHNGFYVSNINSVSVSDLPEIISYLKRGHIYYQVEKYPEILSYIQELKKFENSAILSVIETYFNEYFEEVKEHIQYEENIAFPYFLRLIGKDKKPDTNRYSSNDYKEHHSDIESSLNAFKDLFIQHVHPKSQNPIRRKLLMSISELEFELKIHSYIEDMILIPLTNKLEAGNNE